MDYSLIMVSRTPILASLWPSYAFNGSLYFIIKLEFVILLQGQAFYTERFN